MFSLFIFLLGLLIGSFLNVVICRLESKEPIIAGRSHCPKCGALLKWSDLIPVLSFLIQKGKCRYCGQKISPQYPLVELATGILFVLAFQSTINNLLFFYYLVIISFLIIIFVYDLKHYLIPDKIVYPAILVSGIWYLVSGIFIRNTKYEILNTILAALLAAGFFLSLVFISKGKWLGLGDVKLALLMGLVLGWPNICLALFLSFMGGAMVGIGLIIAKKKSLKSQIPFGPFLAGSTILIIVYGRYLTDWFQNLFYL